MREVAQAAPLSRAEFLESCDDHGRAVYSRILDLASRKGMVLKWGTTCFYIVVDVEGAQVLRCAPRAEVGCRIDDAECGGGRSVPSACLERNGGTAERRPDESG